jgi:hypothetical protein
MPSRPPLSITNCCSQSALNAFEAATIDHKLLLFVRASGAELERARHAVSSAMAHLAQIARDPENRIDLTRNERCEEVLRLIADGVLAHCALCDSTCESSDTCTDCLKQPCPRCVARRTLANATAGVRS